MRRRILAVAAVIFSGQLCNPIEVHAQEDTTARPLDEAVITANRYPNKTSLTGKVITIIDRDEIERSSARDLSQLLSIYSGLQVTGSNGSPARDKTIFLRGAPAEYTLIAIDGVPQSDPSGIGGHFDIRNLSLSNVERIEILKGSQSTLYGSGAIAGVINIITKSADADKVKWDGTVVGGSNNTFKIQVGASGKEKDLDYHLNYSFHGSGGINDAVNGPGNGPWDDDGYRQHVAAVGIGYRISPKYYLHPFLRFGRHRGDIDDGAFADELDFTYEQESLQAGLRNELNLGKARLNVIYHYNFIDRLYVDDSVLSKNGFDVYSKGIYKGKEHFADAFIQLPLVSTWKLTAGVDFRYTHSDQSYESLGAFPYSARYSGDSLHQQQFSFYSAVNFASPRGFHFEAGGRVNVHSEYGTQPVFNLNPSYLLLNKWKFFANLSTGYRTPTVYQLYSEFGNRNLEPEKALTIEGGVQYFSPGNKWKAGVVLFRRNVDDILYFFTDPGTFRSQYINQDHQKDWGMELEATAKLSEKTTLRAFYNYLDGEIRTKVSGRDTTYNNLFRRPRNSMGIALALPIGKAISLSTNVTYAGKRPDLYFDPFLYTTVRDELDGYLLWDIYAECKLLRGKLRVFVDVRNLTSSNYTEISGFNTLGNNNYAGIRLHL